MPLTTLPKPRTPDSMDAPPLRWGILGTGWIADRFVDSLRAHTRQVVHAVGSRSRSSADRAAAAWGVDTAYGSYAALVADPAVDVVYVATPHNFHLPHALLAIRAGRNVLIEKPVGLDAHEARQIHAAAQAAGVFCMEAMWTVFLPKLDVVRQLLADGAIGRPRVVLADMGETFAPDHRIWRPDLAGGPMHDLGTYPTTLATWVLGAPEEVTASGTFAQSGLNEQFAATLRTANGGVGSIFASIVSDTTTGAVIAGESGTIALDRFFYRPGGFSLSPTAGPSLRWDEPQVDHDALHFEAAEVARRITAGETGSPLRPFEATIGTLEVMDRIRAAVGIDLTEAQAARAT